MSPVAGENFGRIQICLCCKAIGKRRNVAIRQIEVDPFNAVHGKEHNRGRERISLLHHRHQIIERCQLNSTEAQAFRRKRQNRAPKFLSRIELASFDDLVSMRSEEHTSELQSLAYLV